MEDGKKMSSNKRKEKDELKESGKREGKSLEGPVEPRGFHGTA